MLEDSSAAIRWAAVTALESLNDDSICTTLLKYLNEANEGVRNAATKALRQRSKESRALVLEMFGKDSSVIDSALDELAPGNAESLAPLRATADRGLSVGYFGRILCENNLPAFQPRAARQLLS